MVLMTTRGPGRVSKLTPTLRDALIDALLNTGNIDEAARIVGLSQMTVRNWLQWGSERSSGVYGDFVAALDRAEAARMADRPPRPKTPKELNDWFESALGVRLPAKSVCEGHDAPLDFVWDVFDNQVEEAIVLASRSAGKTLMLAMLHVANGYWKPGYTTTHFGSVENQAKRAYRYFREFVERENMRGEVPDTGQKRTHWRNGSEIEILPGTEKQAQGPHTHLVTWDELESGERQPYENARGIPITDDEGNPGQFVTTSTRQKAGGLMQQALDDAPNRGARIYTFCVWETLAPTKVPAKCRHSAVEHLDVTNRPAFSCPQPLHKYTSGLRLDRADGWRDIGDVLATYRRMATDAFETQVLNMRPERGALIYAPFSEANIQEGAEYVPGVPVLWGYDAGYNDDTWIGFFQLRGNSFHLFDELTGHHQSERHWIREGIKKIIALPDYQGPTYEQWEDIWNGKRPQPSTWPRVWPNASGAPESTHFRFELSEHGIRAQSHKLVKHNVTDGQNVMRAAMEADGRRRFFVNPRCKVFIKCVGAYMARELPDGTYDEMPDINPSNHKFSHALDGARYLVWRWRRELGIAGNRDDLNDITA